MRKVVGIAVIGAMAAAVLGASPAAFASRASVRPLAPIVRSGHCSGRSTWMLTLKYDSGKIESDVEVQTPRAGQAWSFKMYDNGVAFGSGTKTTLADGSWSATRYAPNRAGVDHIKVTARNLVTGETCAATGAL
jgi:hypothetical protein